MKKLIIVCEEKLRRYGDFLAQLISESDDKDGEIVGIKDGVSAAQVWTDKEYSSNGAQISSEQYLLFIGNSKMFKEKRYHMQRKYSEYGMNYGWLGKQAAMFVDRTLSFSEYENFFRLVTEKAIECHQSNIPMLLPVTQDSNSELQLNSSVGTVDQWPEAEEEKDQKTIMPVGKKKSPKFFEALNDTLKRTADQTADAINKMSKDISAVAKSKEIEGQQYTCLVLLFYLKDLSNFLGIGADNV